MTAFAHYAPAIALIVILALAVTIACCKWRRSPDVAILLIDDMKDPNTFGRRITVARDFASGLAALQERHWDVLLLDHDLADFTGPDNDRERKGVHVLRWLARPENRVHIPGEIHCVSRNNVGAPNIEDEIRALYEDPDSLVILDREYMLAYYQQLGES